MTRKRTTGPHKHYFDPMYDSSICYETDEVRTGDVQGALQDFLKECNVDLGNVRIQDWLGAQ